MKAQCPNCGQWLELPARAATCPNCGTLVTIPVSVAPPVAKLFKPEPNIHFEQPARYVPPAPEAGSPEWVKSLALIGVIGFVAFGLIFLVIWKITSHFNSQASAPPAPIVSAPPPAPAPPADGSKLFSFNQPPAKTEPPAPPPPPPPAVTQPAPDQNQANANRPATAPFVHPTTAPTNEKTFAVTDDAINAAIARGADYLISRFENGKLKMGADDRMVGADALCVLALLHAGQTINDERLNVHNPFLSGALDQLRKMDLPKSLLTYTRSLRAQALAFYNRQEDRSVLDGDVHWLIASSVKGSYSYLAPPPAATQPDQAGWDNSNSQYGALGVWAAADAGLSVPLSYWQDVQTHWESCQDKDGGWDYHQGGAGVLSMTAAGVNMLFVANEMISAQRMESQVARPPFSSSLQAGLDWMAKGDNCVTLTGTYPSYTLYGMERAGLACGFKMFGTHDWFRELASEALKGQQHDNGSWGDEINTAFTMLFLSRGQHPLLMNKLHFVGAWANRPRDVSNLAKFVSREIERPLNWQVVSSSDGWTDWMDAPILYLASHEAPIFDDSDFDKLRAYVRAGGLLLTQADGDSKEFNQFAELLAMKLFDGQELKDLPADHPIFNVVYKPKERFPLKGVSNGTRLLMLHSPTDIAKRWQGRDGKTDRAVFELGANMFIYATGESVPRNRLDTVAIADATGTPTATIPIARLKYDGDWDPEPWAWQRMAKLFRRETNVGLEIVPVEIEKLSTDVAPIAHLTGTATFSLSNAQIAALKKYVESGGVLLIDPCGGKPAVAQSIHANILARAFPTKEPLAVRADHPLVSGVGAGMANLAKAQARPYVFSIMGQHFTRPLLLESGRGAVIVSDLDVTSGLLGTSTWGIAGYEPKYASSFASNLILWAINGRGGAPVWAATQPAKN